MPAVAMEPIAKPIKARLNLNLSDEARNDVNALAQETSRSITELVRLALSVLKVLIEERKRGNKLIVTNADGQPVKELIIPGF
jgi:hypothetical protein